MTTIAGPGAQDGGDWLGTYVGSVVVLDLAEPYLVIGRLERATPDVLVVADADLHDHRESNSSKEIYIIESRRFGVRANRSHVAIPRSQLVAISRLDEVV